MNLEPIGNRLIIQPTVAKEATDSGIIIPDAAKEKPAEGTVVAVGDEVTKIAVGDIVLHSKYAGTEFISNEQSFLLIRGDDVLARYAS